MDEPDYENIWIEQIIYSKQIQIGLLINIEGLSIRNLTQLGDSRFMQCGLEFFMFGPVVWPKHGLIDLQTKTYFCHISEQSLKFTKQFCFYL